MPLLDCTSDCPCDDCPPGCGKREARCDETGEAPPVSPVATTSNEWPQRSCRRNEAGLKGWLHHLRIDG
jgi:hypothetical protein